MTRNWQIAEDACLIGTRRKSLCFHPFCCSQRTQTRWIASCNQDEAPRWEAFSLEACIMLVRVQQWNFLYHGETTDNCPIAKITKKISYLLGKISKQSYRCILETVKIVSHNSPRFLQSLWPHSLERAQIPPAILQHPSEAKTLDSPTFS